MVSISNACCPLPGAAHKLVCYFTNWAFSQPGSASILPGIWTPFSAHLVFAFASMNNNQIVPKDPLDEKISTQSSASSGSVFTVCGVLYFTGKEE